MKLFKDELLNLKASQILFVVKKIIWVLVWIIVWSISSGVVRKFLPNKDIIIDRTEGGSPIGLLSIVSLIIGAVITRFLYMGVILLKEKHYGFFDRDHGIDRDRIIYTLHKKLIDLKQEYLFKEYEYEINYIIKLFNIRMGYYTTENNRTIEEIKFVRKLENWERWGDRYISSGILNRINDVYNENSKSFPDKYEIELICNPSFSNRQKYKVKFEVKCNLGSSFTVYSNEKGTFLKQDSIRGSKTSRINPELISTNEIQKWFKKLDESHNFWSRYF
jgi:hypothetical protein